MSTVLWKNVWDENKMKETVSEQKTVKAEPYMGSALTMLKGYPVLEAEYAVTLSQIGLVGYFRPAAEIFTRRPEAVIDLFS